MTAARTLLVISARRAEAEQAVADGRWPRKDFLELANALRADVLDFDAIAEAPIWRWLSKLTGLAAAQACAAFARRRTYVNVFTDGEHIGIPLALLLRLSRSSPRHTTIGHLPGTRAKAILVRYFALDRRIDAIALHSTRQLHLVRARLHMSRTRLELVPYQVDSMFWASSGPPDAEPVICSAGLEYRDYPTMLAAVRGLQAKAVIAAGSRWSRHGSGLRTDGIPANVEVKSLDYTGLRDLYQRSRFVVIPLHSVHNQAGITTILEAMSMSRAVIVTATPGQSDVVRGRVCGKDGPGAEWRGDPTVFDLPADLLAHETGLYVPPGDPAALRAAIEYLLGHPQEARRMGAAGRRLVEHGMTIERFTQRFAALIAGTSAASTEPSLPRASLMTVSSSSSGAQ